MQIMYHIQRNAWATSYRVGTIVNTNMFAELFHQVLKVVYFQKEQNRRVDNYSYTPI